MNKTQRLAIKKAIEAFTAEATSSPEKARQTLIAEGIYLKNGELAPQYRPPAARKTA